MDCIASECIHESSVCVRNSFVFMWSQSVMLQECGGAADGLVARRHQMERTRAFGPLKSQQDSFTWHSFTSTLLSRYHRHDRGVPIQSHWYIMSPTHKHDYIMSLANPTTWSFCRLSIEANIKKVTRNTKLIVQAFEWLVAHLYEFVFSLLCGLEVVV